ncbi:hypothetical protein FE633_17330 [Streptomyces montanus]|uniref:Uncharacterized protein n=1 Tax=Streptomyces montanus TaxID=2580423 RepID=A0A5R9FQH7_9ACTN|nr:hypothetical protein [Streptomyces montanus]TLS44909.1 hypothetical protein FE633_17330 [Streptomyces montanus]
MSTLTARPSLTKTHSAYDCHTGAMLRDALEALGIVHHVDQPWRGLPTEYLVCSVPGRARVWIHCVADPSARTPEGRQFADHYDLPAVALRAVAATVTDDEGTQFVYNGFGDEHKPTASAGMQAGQCAAAVAEHFGLTLPEPERVCVHCGRGIEWIEDDGQGAWYDSSNWIECVDGESLHAPEPLCGWCEDYGLIEVFDDSFDSLKGHTTCDNAPCVARAEKRAAEYERKRAAEEAEAAAHVCADHLCCPPF